MPRGIRVFLATVLALIPGTGWAQSLQALVGHWVSAPTAGSVAFKLDPGGNCSVDTIEGICHVGADSITMRNANGTLTYSYRVQGDKLTFSGGDLDRPVVFQRVGMAPSPPAPGPFGRTTATPAPLPPVSSQHPIIGRWAGQRGELVVATDGTLSLNGEPASRWQIQGRTLIVNSPDGSILNVPFDVSGNTLTAVVDGEQLRFQRMAGAMPATAAVARPPSAFGGGGSSSGSGQELVGTWCYMANVNAQGGGRMSQRCFSLLPNGSYTYQAESNTSTIYGGTSSAAADSGTWRVQGSMLYATSRREGPLQFHLEKRNHPRTGDPMICLDGDCYVTATQRRPW